MSDDWKVGDLALCVKGGRPRSRAARVNGVWYREEGQRVVVGRVYTVSRIGPHNGDALGLGFKQEPGLWLASRFIKVTPQEPDEFDAEVIFDLNYRASPAFTSRLAVAFSAENLRAIAASETVPAATPTVAGTIVQTLHNTPGYVAPRDALAPAVCGPFIHEVSNG